VRRDALWRSCFWRVSFICATWLILPNIKQRLSASASTEWRRCIGWLKLQVSFRKRATHHKALLRKMTHKDKTSYGSSPPFTWRHDWPFSTWLALILSSEITWLVILGIRLSYVRHESSWQVWSCYCWQEWVEDICSTGACRSTNIHISMYTYVFMYIFLCTCTYTLVFACVCLRRMFDRCTYFHV